MADTFDVIVIGGGPAGENALDRCIKGGLSAAVVERRLLGGECTFFGCVPSKTLIRPGDVLAAARRAPGAAEAVTRPVDAERAFAQRDYMTSDLTDVSDTKWIESTGATIIRGTGRLAGDRAVEVAENEGGTRRLEARRAVVLAAGTAPFVPPVEGLREIVSWDNRDATSAHEVPRRLLVLGGGAVGVELAQAYRRLGSEEVTVVEGGPRLLAREEPFAGEEVREAFEGEGITVLTDVRAERASRDGTVTLGLADGRELEGDELLVAVGRRPETDELGLETVGLEPGKYVETDEQLRVKGVGGGWLYAVGDVNGRALLTHMGKYQGRLAGDVILGKKVSLVSDGAGVPRVTFTDPQVAAVGLTEQAARDAGLDVRVVKTPTGGVPGAYTRGNDTAGSCQLVIDDARKVVVGATFVGPDIQELLHSATIAVVAEVPLDRLWHAVPSFPTVSEVWLRLMEAYGL